MSVQESSTWLDGFDPLAADDIAHGESMAAVFEEASKRVVHNILKSYTGYYDLFSEMIQNALDAVELRQRTEGAGYQPRIWIYLDISSGIVRVVDNGAGMGEREFKYCLRSNVSFKQDATLRGHKGVGATFLAYGFSFLKLQSKRQGSRLSAVLRQGRQWAEDSSGTVPRPKFEAVEFNAPELEGETSGTSVEVIVGQAPGERPRHLAWMGAQSAEQWYTVLRIKSPLGGVYLLTPAFQPRISIKVRSGDKVDTTFETDRSEYYYPHEIPGQKVQSLHDVVRALESITGDAVTKFTKLPADYKRLDSIWEIWGKESLLKEDSQFVSALTEEDRILIERHNVVVYGCFVTSARIWNELNDDVFRLRKGQRILHGGVQMASDFLIQGDLSIIPLTSTIGYQANCLVIVHFTNGNPDMGRKVFQPELKDLADNLVVRTVTIFKRYLQHLRPDTGGQTITPDKELHEWKKYQENHRDHAPLSFATESIRVALVSTPQQEQDAVALFHELVGARVFRGFRFYGTSQSDRYDSLFFMEYAVEDDVLYQSRQVRLGVSRDYASPYTTEPKVLEYKYTFDSLVDDFEKGEKFAKQIDLVVCWSTGTKYKSKYYLQPLLVGDEGSSRKIFGATHQAFAAGTQSSPDFEVIVLEDLLNWLRDPTGEEARQKSVYRD